MRWPGVARPAILGVMIEHYTLYDISAITDRFKLTDGVPKGVKPRYNISPVQPAHVVVKDEDGKTKLVSMSYGLVPAGAKDANSVFRYKTFNVKSEKVFSKPVWESAVRQRRCVIPMNGFYMTRNNPEGDCYYFDSSDGTLMAAAGIYASWLDPSGVERRTFALLTIESNATMPLPFARMPVILRDDDEAGWIDPALQDFSPVVRMMRPYEGSALACRKVSGDVKSAKVDRATLIEGLEKG